MMKLLHLWYLAFLSSFGASVNLRNTNGERNLNKILLKKEGGLELSDVVSNSKEFRNEVNSAMIVQKSMDGSVKDEEFDDYCVENFESLWNDVTFAPMLITNFEIKQSEGYSYISLENEDTSKFRFIKKSTYVKEGEERDSSYWKVETMNHTEAISRVNDLLVETGKKALMFYTPGWTNPYTMLCATHKLNKESDYLVIPIMWDTLNDSILGETIDKFDYKEDRIFVAPIVAKNLGKLFTNFFSQIRNKNWLCHSMGCYVTQQFLQDAYNFYRSPNLSENVALLGDVEASMSCESSDDHPASKAIDGDIDEGFAQTCEQSNEEVWLAVKLPKKYKISNVIIWNRKDCCQDRLHNTKVQIFDLMYGNLVNEEVIQFTPGLQPEKVIVNFDEKYEDDGTLKNNGSVIRIMKSKNEGDPINVNEVEVYVMDDSVDDKNPEKIDSLFMVAPDVRYDLFNEWPLGSGENKNECSPSEWFDENHLKGNPDCRLGGGRAIANMVNDKVRVYWNRLDSNTYMRELRLKIDLIRGWHISIKALMTYGNGEEGREPRSEFKDKVLFIEMPNLTPEDEHSYQFFGEMIEFYNQLVTPANNTISPTNSSTTSPSPVFSAEVMIYNASVCDADSFGAGDSDPYVEVKISENGWTPPQVCGKTDTTDNTNTPIWNEVISCSNVQFKSSDSAEISFEVYDEDSGLNGDDDMIGSGSIVIDTDRGDYDGKVTLENGECNEDDVESNLQFKIHLKQL